ncbi:hypothetical protein MKX01_038522, partial [Papaver californicum]
TRNSMIEDEGINVAAKNKTCHLLAKQKEIYYSTKRQQFLGDQGYNFKTITSFPPAEVSFP